MSTSPLPPPSAMPERCTSAIARVHPPVFLSPSALEALRAENVEDAPRRKSARDGACEEDQRREDPLSRPLAPPHPKCYPSPRFLWPTFLQHLTTQAPGDQTSLMYPPQPPSLPSPPRSPIPPEQPPLSPQIPTPPGLRPTRFSSRLPIQASFNQTSYAFNQPSIEFNQPSIKFNRPQSTFDQPQSTFNQPHPSSPKNRESSEAGPCGGHLPLLIPLPGATCGPPPNPPSRKDSSLTALSLCEIVPYNSGCGILTSLERRC